MFHTRILLIVFLFQNGWNFVMSRNYNRSSEIALKISKWRPEHGGNPWEMSGKFEGDIVLDDNSRNGLLDTKSRWKNGIVPYVIDTNDFYEEDIQTIKGAIKEYHEKTCIRFRKKKIQDTNWITFKSSTAGCYSHVGRSEIGEQIINLQTPGCVRHGIVIHEILHALGFYHQQSSTERDDFIKINWDNIKEGKEHNFLKYNASTITNYGYDYDYGSVMHYSAKAFSKNGKPTIEPLIANKTLGQRLGFSKTDIEKLQQMYKTECKNRSDKTEETIGETILDLLLSLFK